MNLRAKPTLKNLKKCPALFWDNPNNMIRITYPNGFTELHPIEFEYDKPFSTIPLDLDEDNWVVSVFTTDWFHPGNTLVEFIGWLP